MDPKCYLLGCVSRIWQASHRLSASLAFTELNRRMLITQQYRSADARAMRKWRKLVFDLGLFKERSPWSTVDRAAPVFWEVDPTESSTYTISVPASSIL